MENILPYKSLILATFYEKSKSKLAKKKKKKRTYGYYYSNTELVNHFKFLWLVRSLELQANISDKLCTLRSQHLTWGSFS